MLASIRWQSVNRPGEVRGRAYIGCSVEPRSHPFTVPSNARPSRPRPSTQRTWPMPAAGNSRTSRQIVAPVLSCRGVGGLGGDHLQPSAALVCGDIVMVGRFRTCQSSRVNSTRSAVTASRPETLACFRGTAIASRGARARVSVSTVDKQRYQIPERRRAASCTLLLARKVRWMPPPQTFFGKCFQTCAAVISGL